MSHDHTRSVSSNEPEVSILLVNWNTREMTLECLQSIYEEAENPDFEVIVADNASDDGSVDAIAEQFPNVILIRNEENLGFAAATNRQARLARGKRLLLLNTDTLVLDHAVDRLLGFAARRPQARIWGGRTLYPDGSLNPTSCWGAITPWSVFAHSAGLSALAPHSTLCNPRAYPRWRRDTEREVAIVTGCLFLIDREFWEELGGFDTNFFMYGEEADLCLRAKVKGARPAITPNATIIHYDGGSSKIKEVKIIRQLSADMRLAKKHFTGVSRIFITNFICFGVILRAVAFSVAAIGARDKVIKSALVWRGAWARRKEWKGVTC